MLAVVVSADGTPASLRRRRLAGRDVRVSRNPPHARSASPRSAPSGCAARRAPCRRSTASTAPARARLVDAALADADDVWLDPAATRALLSAYGVPLVPEQVVADADEAVAAARALGLPVVLKTAAAGVHKTESGGVALDLETDDEIRAAAERIGGPLLVQPMISGGTELLAGIVQDPVFGPLVAFGPGGVLAELIGGADFRIAPLTDVDADELVHGGKAGQLVARLPRRARRRTRPRSSQLAAPALAARGRPARGRRARPEPRPRPPERLRRRRRAHPASGRGPGPRAQELVAAGIPQRRQRRTPDAQRLRPPPTLGTTATRSRTNVLQAHLCSSRAGDSPPALAGAPHRPRRHQVSASLVIRHQMHGCHSWSVNGGPFKASQSITLRRGGSLTVTDNDVMPHTLVLTSGPALRIAHPKLGHMGASLKITLTKPGVYHFTTKAGEDYMAGMKTIGEDNVLKLTVVVSSNVS